MDRQIIKFIIEGDSNHEEYIPLGVSPLLLKGNLMILTRKGDLHHEENKDSFHSDFNHILFISLSSNYLLLFTIVLFQQVGLTSSPFLDLLS